METGTNKRIARNTLMLYTRQVIILLVSLYTVRIVLNTLGVEDYGIYTVIGGVVALFSFLRGSMASATQRFFSFAIGQNNIDKLRKTFSVNLLIYIGIAIFALLLLETIGIWFIDNQLKVPEGRFDASISVYHYSVFTFVITILTTPFLAIIIAHEDMQIYAYVSIIEVLLKLIIVFLIVFLPFDKLKVYGILIFIVSVLNGGLYIGISFKKYSECQLKKFYWDKALFKEISEFTGWTLFGQLTTVLRNQAVTILLNQIFSPIIVAARAIAINITSKINIFSNNFNVGLYPPIIKAYAEDKKDNMYSLIFNGSKITFFLMWVFALPLLIEMDIILNTWLKTPPEGAIIFTRLALIEVLINSISLPIGTAARAPGRMRSYELVLGSFQILIFFIDLLILKMGGAAYSVFIVAIIINCVMFWVRLLLVNSLIKFPIKLYIKQVILPVSLVIFISSTLSNIINLLLPEKIIYVILSVISSMTITTICMYKFGIDLLMRNKLKEMMINHIKHFQRS